MKEVLISFGLKDYNGKKQSCSCCYILTYLYWTQMRFPGIEVVGSKVTLDKKDFIESIMTMQIGMH